MKIAKGIKGIRKTINDNKVGWHLVLNNHEAEYVDSSFKSLLNTIPEEYTLIWVGGNVLFATTEPIER